MMPSNPLSPFLDQQNFILLDGALATELETRGAKLNDPLWSAKLLIEAPDLIQQVHYDYFMAGADVAITASYQASFQGFAGRGLSQAEAAHLMRLSVTLAQQARDEFWSKASHRQNRQKPLVAASVGCYGAILHDGSEYHGNYGLTQAELMAFHRPRLEVLLNSGADLLACETIPSKLEGQALVALLNDYPQAKAWLSYSCQDEQHVNHGESLQDCVALAEDCEQIVAVGINCTAPRFISPLLQSIQSHTSKAIIVYPNSGEIWNAQAHCWEAHTGTTDFRQPAHTWLQLGAKLIGGCCRTTPKSIQELTQSLKLPANSNSS